MARRGLFAVIWFVVIYLAGCALAGGIAGAMAGAKDPANSSQVGAIAGMQAVDAFRSFIFLASVLLSGLGTYLQLLPGTKPRR